MKPTVIFDIDGTLLDLSNVGHDWALGKRTDYDEFHRLALDAEPNYMVKGTLHTFWDSGYQIVISTARSELYWDHTNSWLDEYNLPFHYLMMRGVHDMDPDRYVKVRHLEEMRKKELMPILAFEDNPALLAMYADHGIRTVRVPGFPD